MEKFVHDGHASREGVLAAATYTKPKAATTTPPERQNAINILIPPERQVRPKIMLYGYIPLVLLTVS
jgi:hypothetical protein